MLFLLFLLNAVCYAGQSATGKAYAIKGGSANSFNFCKALSAAVLFFLWVVVRGSVHWHTFPLAFLYGLCLTVSMYFGFRALSCGPMALTGIIAAMSLLIPFAWGLIFWHEACPIQSIAGICILLASLVLISYKKQGGFSLQWLIYSLITLVANGFCSVIQKYHQIAYPGMYHQDFMLFAMITVTCILLVRSLLCKDRCFSFSILGISSGILNGMANFIVLILASSQNASKLFPLISSENVMAAWLTGILFFREHIRKYQLAGLALGIGGLIIFNL